MESGNNKEFDRHIKAKLDEVQPEVPATLWNAIANELPAEENVRKITGKRRYPYAWLAVAACLLIAFSVWKLQPQEVIHLRSADALVVKSPNGGADKEVSAGARQSALPVLSPSDALPDEPAMAAPVKNNAAYRPAVRAEHYASVRKAETEPQRDIQALELPEAVFIQVPEKSSVLEEEVAFVPVPFEEESEQSFPEKNAETLSAGERSRPKVVSSVLNFIASNIQIGGGGTRVEFSETEHGVLKVDIKGFLNKNNQGL